ncbi:MAG: protein-export chaperone SecB [Hyphomicrobiaceae bacterium]
MTDAAETNGTTGGAATAPGDQVQVRVVGQYIKDLSFESPNLQKMLSGTPENPNLTLDLDVRPEQIGPDLYETSLVFKARAESSTVGVIYEMELIYGGLFKIEKAPPQAVEVMLNINGPHLLFPYLRRLVSDLTREGGFPPLLLDPVDFGALFMRKRAQQPPTGQQPPPATA